MSFASKRSRLDSRFRGNDGTRLYGLFNSSTSLCRGIAERQLSRSLRPPRAVRLRGSFRIPFVFFVLLVATYPPRVLPAFTDHLRFDCVS